MSWLLVLLVAKLLGRDDLAGAAGVATARFVTRGACCAVWLHGVTARAAWPKGR